MLGLTILRPHSECSFALGESLGLFSDGGEVKPWDLDHLIHSTEHSNTHIFVMFYIPKNRNCKNFMPVWDELHRRFASVPTVDILKLDCSGNNAHMCDDHHVRRFPTLQVFRPGLPDGEFFEPNLRADLYTLEQWVHSGIDDPAWRDPREVDAISGCIAFRRTRACDPHGDREHHKDRGCDDKIDNGVEGFCECSEGDYRHHVSCQHDPFFCREICIQVPGCNAWRQTTGCSPLGPPEPSMDLHCHRQVPPGVSGYCECSDGRLVHESTCARTVTFTCEHECNSGAPGRPEFAAAVRKIAQAAARIAMAESESERRKAEQEAAERAKVEGAAVEKAKVEEAAADQAKVKEAAADQAKVKEAAADRAKVKEAAADQANVDAVMQSLKEQRHELGGESTKVEVNVPELIIEKDAEVAAQAVLVKGDAMQDPKQEIETSQSKKHDNREEESTPVKHLSATHTATKSVTDVRAVQIGAVLQVLSPSHKWRQARVEGLDDGGQILVHYEGYDQNFDEWIHLQSDRIRGLPRISVPQQTVPETVESRGGRTDIGGGSDSSQIQDKVVVAPQPALDRTAELWTSQAEADDQPAFAREPSSSQTAVKNEKGEWKRFVSQDGRPYYHNPVLKKTQWEAPPGWEDEEAEKRKNEIKKRFEDEVKQRLEKEGEIKRRLRLEEVEQTLAREQVANAMQKQRLVEDAKQKGQANKTAADTDETVKVPEMGSWYMEPERRAQAQLDSALLSSKAKSTSRESVGVRQGRGEDTVRARNSDPKTKAGGFTTTTSEEREKEADRLRRFAAASQVVPPAQPPILDATLQESKSVDVKRAASSMQEERSAETVLGAVARGGAHEAAGVAAKSAETTKAGTGAANNGEQARDASQA